MATPKIPYRIAKKGVSAHSIIVHITINFKVVLIFPIAFRNWVIGVESAAQKAEIESLVQQGKEEINDLQTYVDAKNYGQAKQSLNDVHLIFKEIYAKVKESAGGDDSLRAIAGAPRTIAPLQKTEATPSPTRIPRDRVSTQQIPPRVQA